MFIRVLSISHHFFELIIYKINKFLHTFNIYEEIYKLNYILIIMNIIHNSSITINNKKYKYKIFDTLGLIDLIRNNKKFIESLENSIKLYRKDPDFEISDLVKEWIYYRPDDITTYFIVYKKWSNIVTILINISIEMISLLFFRNKIVFFCQLITG